MENDKEYEDFKHFISIQNNKVKNNITEVKADKLYPYMLHIDRVTPKKFIPMMPRSAGTTEDNTIARVTVADTLLGCILGYARIVFDFGQPEEAGYYINKLKFNYCVKPNQKLVYDAEKTNEHWLVGYSSKTLNYQPETIGKMFVHRVEALKRKVNKDVVPYITKLEILLQIDESLQISKTEKVESGYYKIYLLDDFTLNYDYDDVKNHVIEKITAKEYTTAKNISATMLSRDTVLNNW